MSITSESKGGGKKLIRGKVKPDLEPSLRGPCELRVEKGGGGAFWGKSNRGTPRKKKGKKNYTASVGTQTNPKKRKKEMNGGGKRAQETARGGSTFLNEKSRSRGVGKKKRSTCSPKKNRKKKRVGE